MVGGYTLTFLALGGQSVVYKGEKLGKTVVLKEVETSNTKEVPALLSEKMLLERLNHPGLVNYHSLLNEHGSYFLVVEYVPGQPLSRYLDPSDPPSVEQVADWGVQLCDIFEYLHGQRPPVIYRDLKPENVLLVEGKVKLIDFGIARLHKGGERQKDTELMGSRMTASPEHYGRAETDARSDIYTLGATVYELLTGGQRKSVGAFAFAPVRELRPEVPPALEAALSKALQFKPEDRFASAHEFGNALLAALGQPARAPQMVDRRAAAPPPRPAPVSPKRKVRPLRLVLILLVLGALGFAANHWQAQYLQAAANAEFPPSTGVQEASLKGDLFAAGQMPGGPVVFMGEDVGLFQVTSWKEETSLQRASTIADRLNRFYKTACLQCGGSTLESADIRVGKFKETGEVVVFYAHIHGDERPQHGPLLLATVDEEQGKALGKPVLAVASYWRDMVRDTIDLSRGLPVENSALGSQLTEALRQARAELKPEASSVDNLRAILRETTGSQALQLRELFLTVPDRPGSTDRFANIKDYEPLPD